MHFMQCSTRSVTARLDAQFQLRSLQASGEPLRRLRDGVSVA